MRPPAFRYVRADSKAEALHHLAEFGDEARLLAGGLSLVPMMNFRVARPEVIIDISRARDLAHIRVAADGSLSIGAMTSHRTVESAEATEGSALAGLASAAPWIGHYPIRLRGTFGGSIAHGDPAAEWCLMARLLDATVRVESSGGVSEIPAEDFFLGYYSTHVAADEMVTEVTFPPLRGYCALDEYAARAGDFGIVLVGVALDGSGGVVRSARFALGGVADTPVRLPEVEELVSGEPLTDEAIGEAARLSASVIDPSSDTAGSSDYRRSLAERLVERALLRARESIEGDVE